MKESAKGRFFENSVGADIFKVGVSNMQFWFWYENKFSLHNFYNVKQIFGIYRLFKPIRNLKVKEKGLNIIHTGLLYTQV